MSKICATTGKVIYNTEKEAYKGLNNFLKQLSDYDGEPYYCFYCGFYHFGKKRDKPIKKKRKRT